MAGGRRVAAAAQAACREGPAAEAAGRARAERTLNMDCMFVTLEVSKLSGWLNADAYCRVKKGSIGRGVTCGSGGGKAWSSGGGASSVLEGPKRDGGRARAERTENMYPMPVTLEVSRLSGWLNADAPCQVEGEA